MTGEIKLIKPDGEVFLASTFDSHDRLKEIFEGWMEMHRNKLMTQSLEMVIIQKV